MTARLLHESGGALRASEGGKWSATLITPGTGSSGTYSEEMLAEHGAKAFKAGMKMWWGHPKEGSHAGERDARDQWGVLEEDASFVEGEGLVGKIRLLPHWRDVVESLGDQASLSIYAMGESDKDGNVVSLLEDRTNSVDIVSYPGREGSGLKQKLEAARAASTQPDATSAQGSHMQEVTVEKEVLEAAVKAAIAEALAPITAFLANEDARRQAEADASDKDENVTDAVEAAVTAVEAVKAAKVLPSLEAKLVESAKRGEDVTEALEFAKTVTAEAHAPAEVDTPSIYVHESASSSDTHDFTIARLIGA